MLSTPTIAAETGLTSSGVDSMAFVKMFVGLIVTIGVILLLAWLSRKTRLLHSFSSGHQIKTLASLSLTSREKLCLVEVGDKQILIGVAPGHVNQVHVFDEPIPLPETEQQSVESSAFADQFKQAMGWQANQKE